MKSIFFIAHLRLLYIWWRLDGCVSVECAVASFMDPSGSQTQYDVGHKELLRRLAPPFSFTLCGRGGRRRCRVIGKEEWRLYWFGVGLVTSPGHITKAKEKTPFFVAIFFRPFFFPCVSALFFHDVVMGHCCHRKLRRWNVRRGYWCRPVCIEDTRKRLKERRMAALGAEDK